MREDTASCAFSPLSDYSFAYYDRLVRRFDVLRARGQADGRCRGVRQSSNTLAGCTNPDLISNVYIEILCHILDTSPDERHLMKFAVIGGTGLIGSQVVKNLNAAGHEAVPHSQSTGIDVISGQGLGEAVAGADVIVNLTNSPTFDEASPAFFQTSMDNLLAAAQKGGVGHFVILSIVGVDQVPELDYYRAKVLQEDILAAGPVPYSIVRATQFMEFMDAVLSWTADGDTVRLPATPIQPIASKDVADAVAEVAAGAPLGGIRNIAGPEVFSLDELGRITLTHKGDGRTVVTDPTAGMFAVVKGDVLTDKEAHLAPTRYVDWLS